MRRALTVLAAALCLAAPASAAARCSTGWSLVGTDTFRGQDALVRSQGATSDGDGWVFSWQGGLERTRDDFTPTARPRGPPAACRAPSRSEEHTSELQSRSDLVCRLLLEKKK